MTKMTNYPPMDEFSLSNYILKKKKKIHFYDHKYSKILYAYQKSDIRHNDCVVFTTPTQFRHIF